jgi:predicted nucleic acid-binding protein
MPDNKPPLFFDTVVLSNFAFADNGILFLKNRYQKRGIITLQVMQEIAKTTYAGYPLLDELSKIKFRKITLRDNELDDYLKLLRQLGEGEASCIAAAMHRKGIVVTDDRCARNSCKDKNVPVTGTIGILKAAYLDATLELDIADTMLKQMVQNGFYSPVNKISDLI